MPQVGQRPIPNPEGAAWPEGSEVLACCLKAFQDRIMVQDRLKSPGLSPAIKASGGALAGQLLIAMPSMTDPRFVRTVICVCAHTSDGAMGIVVNRALDGPSFTELLDQLQVTPRPPLRRLTMCAGGPVEPARGFVLHTSDWTDEGSLPVGGGMTLTANLEILRAIAGGAGPRAAILALGYAGWSPGQLDQEIQANAWLSVDPDEAIIFDAEYGTKWRRALARLHVDPFLLSREVGHA